MSRKIAAILILGIVALLVIPTTVNAQNGTSSGYSVVFRETGLPNGTQWSISVNGISEKSNGTNITFTEPNGTYNFTIGGVRNYMPLPRTFSVNVKGSNVSLVVVWVPVLYSVTFIETGLPGNTFWNVTLGNDTKSSSNTTISFKMMNGTYEYDIPDVNGITSSTPNGTIKISGAPTEVFVVFTGLINFTFYEQGLPSGTRWSVWIDGTYHNSTSYIIYVSLPNGTYNFVVSVPSGYSANPSTGSINYSNELVLVGVTSLLPYEVLIAVLVILIGFLLTIYIRTRMKNKNLHKK